MAYRAKREFSNLYGVYEPGDELIGWSGQDIASALQFDLVEAFEPSLEPPAEEPPIEEGPPLEDGEEE